VTTQTAAASERGANPALLEERRLRPVFAAGDWVEEVLASTVSLDVGVTGWVVRNRSTRNVPNTQREPLAVTVAGTDDAAEAMVSVPLVASDRVVGALNVFRPSAQAFDAAEVELVERFATMAALAYDSARQRETLRRQVPIASDPAELASLEEEGMAALLMVPVVSGDRNLALIEIYGRHPQAFTSAEVDHARVVAQQFGAVLDRLGL
jgi:GAF domain-containing protein